MQRYGITATLNVGAGTLRAVERMTLTNDRRTPINHVNLSVLPRAFGYFAFTGPVTVSDKRVSTMDHAHQPARALGRWLAPGQNDAIRIPFSLAVGSSGGAFTARLSRDRGVISFGEWFPIISRVHDSYGVGDPQVTRTAEQIRLRADHYDHPAAQCGGLPGIAQRAGDIGQEMDLHLDPVRDFSFVVNPRFRLTTRKLDGILLRVYTESVSRRGHGRQGPQCHVRPQRPVRQVPVA